MQNQNNNTNSPQDKRPIVVDQRFKHQIEAFAKQEYSLSDLPSLVIKLGSQDILLLHQAVIGIRKIVSVPDEPPIQALIDANLVPVMVKYAHQTEYPQLQLEATWILVNTCSSTTVQCQRVIDFGGIELFVGLLDSNILGVVEQAIWALGNIASDISIFRDRIIQSGGVHSLVNTVNRVKEGPIFKFSCWALSNLCRGSPLPNYDSIREAIICLCQALASGMLHDMQTKSDCLWAISHHCSPSLNQAEVIVASGVIPTIIQHLTASQLSVVVPCLRILGYISAGKNGQCDILLANYLLNHLQRTLRHKKTVVRCETCLVISNVVAEGRQQVEAVLSRQNIIQRLVEMFDSDSDRVKREVCYIFSNMAQAGYSPQIYSLSSQSGIVRRLLNLLGSSNPQAVLAAIDSLQVVLQQGDAFRVDGRNPLMVELERLGGVRVLRELQSHHQRMINIKASMILVSLASSAEKQNQ